MTDPPAIPNAHVIPIDDAIEHEASEDCICGPEVKFAPGGGIVYSHHYLQTAYERDPTS